MNQKILNKTVAVTLVIILTITNILILASESYALNTNLETQGTNTNNNNVQFDAYFKDEKGEKTHTVTKDINEQDTLYLYVSVTEGYLKETNITLNNPNFELISEAVNYDEIEKIDKTSNTITLNKIRNQESVELAIPVKAKKADEIAIDMFSKETEISINGLLVKNDSRTSKITKTIRVNQKWQGNAEVNLEQGVIKYIPFEENEQKGIVLQTKIKSNIINNNLPVEKTKIKALIPTINGISPKKIYVTADSLQGTNGENTENFTTSNWKKEENYINIEVANTVKNNTITWKKGIDEYILTFIYGEEAYETVKTEGAKTTLQATAEISVYNLETTKLTKEDRKEGTLNEKVNDIVMFDITTQETTNKGYMYTKVDETTIPEAITIDIANQELIDNIIINENKSNYKTETEEYLSNTRIVNTKISKENFNKMLGEEGYIKIYNENNQQIAEINKNTTQEENYYIINYDTEISSIKIETSKPINVGKIKIENTKAITKETTYNEETIKNFKSINTKITAEVNYNEKQIITLEKETLSTLVEPTTKAETIISNNTLSTIVENKNVEIKTILKSTDITCKLYKNPIITIKLPDYVENVTFNEAIKMLFTDELEIETGTYNPETKTIEVHLKGEQTIYNDVSIAEGPTLVVNANITLNELTPSKEDKVITTITNEEEAIQTETNIKYIAPIGMVTVNTISGYNEGETATSVSGQESTGKIDTNSNAKTAIVTLTLINNNNNVCKNIEILGRTPFEGNKSISTGEDLGSTFTASVTSGIKAIEGIDNNQIIVYYSTNENATKDLQDETNGWTVTPEDLSLVKSYLIIVSQYEMQIGDKISFEYNTQIPEGLRNDESTYGTFVVYYDNVIAEVENTIPENQQQNNNTQNQNVIENTIDGNTINQNTINENVVDQNTINTNNTVNQNTVNQNTATPNNNQNTPVKQEVLIPGETHASMVGVATNETPEVEISVTSDADNENIVKIGQVINYTITVVNLGDETIENAKLIFDIPEGTTYRELIPATSYSYDKYQTNADVISKELTINSLEKNKSAKMEVQVIVNESNLNSITAQAKMEISGANEITSQENKKVVVEGALNIDVITTKGSTREYLEGEEIEYIAKVQNVTSSSVTQVTVESILPEEVDFVEIDYVDNGDIQATYNEETRKATWKIKTISANSEVTLILKGTVKQGAKEITNSFTGMCYELSEEVTSNKVTRKVSMPQLEVKHSTSVLEEYVDVGDILEYYIEIKNIGTSEAKDVQIIDYLPSGVEEVKLSYINNGQNSEEYSSKNGTVTLSGITIEPQATLLVKITAKVSELEENAKGTIELSNYAKVSANKIEEITTQTITHKIKTKDQVKPDEEKTIEITGIAWLDESRDGIRDDNEKLLKDIDVTLITKETAEIVKTTKTNKNGEYSFKNIEKGEYLIVFEFDTTKYEITKYQVEGANEGKNSDAALQQVTFLSNGKTIEGAVTNTIKVEEANLYNIDIGLLESMKFDLSLTKTISKVTKQNNDGIKTYDYTGKGKTLSKIEIPSKQVNNTNLIIEYTITVKNEGNIAGYAKQIVDYLPNDLKFASELNEDWYRSTDGNLYNKSLADAIINPGETKEIKLVVTKTTSESNLGTTNNSAEIYESYNDYGIADIDSNIANNVAKEDDYGSADIIISLNTGTIAMYTGLIISMIAIIGVGAYMINKKVLGKM